MEGILTIKIDNKNFFFIKRRDYLIVTILIISAIFFKHNYKYLRSKKIL
jgi:hypothetical protein